MTEKKVTFGSTSNDGKDEKNEKLRAKLSKGVGMVSESTDNETYVIDGQCFTYEQICAKLLLS